MWHELIDAAETAGREAAPLDPPELRCAARAGRPCDVHIELLESPVAEWLHRTRRAAITALRTGALVPVALTTADLHPTADVAQECRSMTARPATTSVGAPVRPR